MASDQLHRLLSRGYAAVRDRFCRTLRRAASRKGSVVVCPRDRMPAAVALDGEDRLLDCSRWSPSATCSEACVPQLQYSGDDLATFLRRTAEMACSRCGDPIGAEDWYASRMALGADRRRSAAWISARPAAPLCSKCMTCL